MAVRAPRWQRRAYNIAALRAQARRVLPHAVFDFVDGGAGDEHTLRRNEAAFEQVALYPRPIGGRGDAQSLDHAVRQAPVAPAHCPAHGACRASLA